MRADEISGRDLDLAVVERLTSQVQASGGGRMTELPRGTVTLVFTDIEGSTRLLASLGPRYEEVLADHRRLLREAFGSHAGVEVDTQGDAFFYAFPRAQDALAGAVAGQRALASHSWPENAELRVRMGIHTGEPTVSAEGYVGADVHLGARICSAAWGEQILVSDATVRLLGDNEGASLRDLGEHSLKDIDVPERLHQAVAPGLREDFPPPRTAASHPTNLPPALSPLVGRAEDISELVTLLGSDDVRVVTLTGPGGVGKTRLALALGAEVLLSFPDGVFFVDLSALSDPSLVVGAIAAALGLREAPGRSLTETLSDYLASRRTLLILDNLEHLLTAASDVSGLVISAPGLKMLVTSREPMRIAGEHEVPLAPLSLPLQDADASEVLTSPAAELFVARARDLRPGFELTTDDATSVARICRRMDGLPLAIELAAARTKVLSLPALATRLEDSLGALGQGRRDASARQRTLRGAIEWSYELLSPDEQILFRRLGVFAGGWTLEAAEAVCDRGDLSTDVLDGLASLVDKSLVRAREHEDRFVMLETIRSFAADELDASGEAEEIRREHAYHFRGLAEDAEPHLARAEQKEWLDRLERDHDNIRAALGWLLGNDVEQAGRCAVSLRRFWQGRGLAREGYSVSLEILEAGEGHLELTLVARLCHEVGSLAGDVGDHDTARLHLERALSLFQESSDDGGIALTMMELAWLTLLEGDIERAEQLARRATELAMAADDQALYGRALFIEATVSLEREDSEFTKERFQQSLAVREDAGDRGGVARVLGNLGVMYLEDDQPAEARTLLERALRQAREIGDIDALSRTTVNLGFVSLLQGRNKEATSWFRDSLAGAEKTGARYVTVYGIEGLACAAVTQGRSSDAARLFGLAEALRKDMRVPRTRGEDELYAAYLDKARRELGLEEWTRLTSQAETGRDPLALPRLLAHQIALTAHD
jgi:predicted ATPase/class 3 adenylate cyclase/Tfp pilus assembly protein PilF